MAIGRVVKFDQTRGFGFIAPTDGGEDVFLHVNDLLMSESELRPGITVEFDVDAGGRGLKGSNIRLAERTDTVESPWRQSVPGPLAPGSLAPGALASGSFSAVATAAAPVAVSAPVTAPAPAVAVAPIPSRPAVESDGAEPGARAETAVAGDDDYCDVLSQGEFSGQITEVLLNGLPTLTGGQIVAVRQLLVEFCTARGWVSA